MQGVLNIPSLATIKQTLSEHLPKPPSLTDIARQPAHYLLKPAEKVPFLIQRNVIHKVLNEGFAEAIEDGDFDCLKGRWIEVRLTDVNLSWCLSLSEQNELLIEQNKPAETQISGDAIAFALIAGGKMDPDTLFFQRRIVITGDTELGHEVKNLLDGLDKDAIPPAVAQALDKVSTLASSWERFRKEMASALYGPTKTANC